MNPTSLLLNNKTYNYERIRRGEYHVSSSFEEITLSFCMQWLNGQEEFEQKTSGSTGSPKLITLTRAQMIISAKQTIVALKLKAHEIAFVCIDPAYIGGKMMLVRAFENHMQIIIVEPSSNPLDQINISFHFAAMVPMQFENSIDNSTNKKRLNDCKAIIIGGAPVSHSLANRIAQIEFPVFSTYGMTETVSHIALKRLSLPPENHYTIIGDVEIKKNSKDQLIIKGAVTNYSEVVTNDRVNILSPTTFIWLGRIDNVINSGGVKIQLEEVESSIDVLFSTLNISNRFFLVGKPDEYLGVKVVLFIEYPKQLSLNKLSVQLKNHLDKFTCPKEIIYVPKFAETTSGKINKTSTISDYI